MSGHNKWASIKHKKAATDAKRGKIFTKIIREMVVAAKEGGGIIENNARLRKAVDDARAANMPQDNIKKAIQRGTGELPGAVYEEITYEGYGPAGVALIVETTTDNKNRTASEIRKIFSKHSGSMGESGCVGWMFSKKGFISIDKSAGDEDTIMTIALDAGAEDFVAEDDCYEILTVPDDFSAVREALEKENIPMIEADVTMIPQTYVKLTSDEDIKCIQRILDLLDEDEDVQMVYHNWDE